MLLVLIGGGLAIWATRSTYLDTRAVARTIGARLHATVRCPEHAARTTGTTFRCAVTDRRGRTEQVKVDVLSDSGRYRWSVLPSRS